MSFRASTHVVGMQSPESGILASASQNLTRSPYKQHQKAASSYGARSSSSRTSVASPIYPPSEMVAPSVSINSQVSNQIPVPSRSTSVNEPCCVCGCQDKQTFTCVQCNNDSFCDSCWGKERPHRPGAVGIDGLPHEKTNRQVVERLRQILDPTRTSEQQQGLHKNDEDTTWFGIARDSANLPIFQDYGRYATIMAESRTPEVNVRYPQLISFIGQTGMQSIPFTDKSRHANGIESF